MYANDDHNFQKDNCAHDKNTYTYCSLIHIKNILFSL